MPELGTLELSRIQFAANITFHILFPTITIALGWFLLFFKLRFNATGDEKWMDVYKLYVKVFALCFALGVVSGITMSFQFGTNWPGFMETVGNVAGPLLAYEVLTAFFLEATFLGIMLFGWGRVPGRIHTLATFLVAFGTTLSAFWIMVLNSWMQTPAGFEMRDGVAHATDWMAIIFNPSMPYRLVHMLLASGLTASFVVSGLAAYRWLRGGRGADILAAMKAGIVTAAALIPLQIVGGDMLGLNTLEHQPAKIAAIEGIWETDTDVPMLLFGIPNPESKANDWALEVPGLASLILTHKRDGELKGLNEFEGAHPPVAPLFWGFRIMVGIGLLMLAASWYGAWRLRKGREPGRKFAWLLALMTFSGWGATVAGWYVTEIGRQPYLVYNVLKTADAVTQVPAPMVGLSLGGYLLIYTLLLAAFITTLFYLARRMDTDADAMDRPPVGTEPGKAATRRVMDKQGEPQHG